MDQVTNNTVETVEEKAPGKIEQIIALHKAGKTKKEIIEMGFNKTTVSIQIAKYEKSLLPATSDEEQPSAEQVAG